MLRLTPHLLKPQRKAIFIAISLAITEWSVYTITMINKEKETTTLEIDETTGLEIGRDYGVMMGMFGTGNKMIYNGGISWTVVRGTDGETLTADSQAQTDNVVTDLAKI